MGSESHAVPRGDFAPSQSTAQKPTHRLIQLEELELLNILHLSVCDRCEIYMLNDIQPVDPR